MKQNKKKISKRKVGTAVLILIILIILACFTYSMIQLLIEPTEIFIVENGYIYEEEQATGYVIRDERIISGENYQNGIITIKNEGEKVAKGSSVFRYCSQDEEKLEGKISELDKEIQEAINGQNLNIYSTDIQLLDKQIEEKLLLIQKTNSIEEISLYKSDIAAYMIKKSKIAGELSPAGSYISKLIKERSELENQLNSGQEYIKATSSGIVSYKIDGYEEMLSTNNLEDITKEKLENIKIKTGQLISKSTEQGKIVNNFYCYIAVVLSSDNALNASVGDIVKLRLGNNSEISAEIIKISEFNNGETVMFFKITKGVEYLINYRKISVNIVWWSASGLKVPNSAIVSENEKDYVIRNRIGYTDKILVKIKNKNKNYSIITNYTTQELRDLGYTTEDINGMKNVNLHDEIMLKP